MNAIKPAINYNNQILFQKRNTNTDYNQKQKNHNKSKIIIASLVGIAAISAGSIALIKSGKLKKINKPKPKIATPKIIKNNNIPTAEDLASKNEEITSIKDLIFKKGIAKNKKGENFSGTIEHILENEEKVKLTYQDGLIQKSEKTGEKGFIKTYLDNSIITEYNDGSKTKLFFKDGKLKSKEIYNLGDISYAEYSYYPSGKIKKTYTLKADSPIIESLNNEHEGPTFITKKKGSIFTDAANSIRHFFKKISKRQNKHQEKLETTI